MEYVRFGRTENVVSRLGFGGAPAGLTNYLDPYSPRDTDQRKGVVAAIRRALELGVTYFDTAPGYGDGAGESIFGEALSDAGPEIFVATKVAPTTSDVRASVEASLRRLRRDHIDLVQIHGSTYPTDLANDLLEGGGIVDQIDDLRADGLVRFIGFTSEDNNPAVFRFIETGRFDPARDLAGDLGANSPRSRRGTDRAPDRALLRSGAWVRTNVRGGRSDPRRAVEG